MPKYALRLIAPFILLALIIPAALLGAGPAKFELTVENIMRGPGLVGWEPRDVRWSGDGQRIYFSWKQPSDAILADYDTYVVNRDGSGLRKLSEDEARLAPPSTEGSPFGGRGAGELSHDHSKIVYSRDRDLYLYDLNTDKGRRLTKTGDIESSPHFLPDNQHVSFVRANNMYVVSLEDGMVERITNMRAAQPPSASGAPAPRAQDDDEDKKGTASQEYLKKQQKELLDIVKQRDDKREQDRARRLRDNPRKPYRLQGRQAVRDMMFTPDGKYILAYINEPGSQAERVMVANAITDTGYTEPIPNGRTKVGDNQDQLKLAVINAANGELKWVTTGLKPLAPEKKPEAKSDDEKKDTEASADQEAAPMPRRPFERAVTFGGAELSEDGSKIALIVRSQDNKDKWIMALDPAAAKTRVLASMHDDAWIGGPGVSTLGWMKDDNSVFYQSEATGYSHLYSVSYEGGEPKQLTSGNWEVLSVTQSQDKSNFYLETNEVGPAEHHFYRMSAGGGERVKLTSAVGFHNARLSRDEKYLADIYGYTTKPPEIYVQEATAGAQAKQLTTSPTPEFFTYKWMDAPIVTITARDGTKVPGQLFKPVDGKRGGAAVIFVHGAGYAQNVHKGWAGGYYREYLFHNLLAEHGYTVLQIDYRASAGYGRNWRTAIYRHMGGTDLDDEVDAANWLVKEQGVDPKRIGIYGGSYGGFMTLMAMFTSPDTFAAGAALRPVTNWANYNHPYTSGILNLPQNDDEAYRKSSPIYFANGLKGRLLICHGMVDTNVHFQDTVELVQKLIELRKKNWDLAVFPVEDHGFVQPTSWMNEYGRIAAMFDETLKPEVHIKVPRGPKGPGPAIAVGAAK